MNNFATPAPMDKQPQVLTGLSSNSDPNTNNISELISDPVTLHSLTCVQCIVSCVTALQLLKYVLQIYARRLILCGLETCPEGPCLSPHLCNCPTLFSYKLSLYVMSYALYEQYVMSYTYTYVMSYTLIQNLIVFIYSAS